jgi:hypothetical protein
MFRLVDQFEGCRTLGDVRKKIRRQVGEERFFQLRLILNGKGCSLSSFLLDVRYVLISLETVQAFADVEYTEEQILLDRSVREILTERLTRLPRVHDSVLGKTLDQVVPNANFRTLKHDTRFRGTYFQTPSGTVDVRNVFMKYPDINQMKGFANLPITTRRVIPPRDNLTASQRGRAEFELSSRRM